MAAVSHVVKSHFRWVGKEERIAMGTGQVKDSFNSLSSGSPQTAAQVDFSGLNALFLFILAYPLYLAFPLL